MKKLILASIVLTAISCQKEKADERKPIIIRTFEFQVEEVKQDGTTTFSQPMIFKFKN